MSTLHLTRGLPASGKTTFALEWVAQAPDTRARLNRDDLRAMVHAQYGGYDTERAVTIVQHNAANALFRKGYDVIVDDTNLTARFTKEWMKLAERAGADVVFHDQFMDVPLQTCIERDHERHGMGGRGVGSAVITNMHAKYLNRGPLAVPVLTDEQPAGKPYTGTPGAVKAIVVDIDGTLALNTGGRSPYDWGRVGEDDLNVPVARLVSDLAILGYEVILMSGRDELCRDLTLEWLEKHDVQHLELFMRPQDDNRKDSVVKLELFDAHVRDNYDVRYVIDDRNQVVAAWRSIGLPVLQVADGDF